MALKRFDLIDILTDYLTGKSSQEKTYEWALARIVSEEYDQLKAEDPLAAQTIQVIVDMNRDNLDYVPTKDDLNFYLRCLEGKETEQALEAYMAKVSNKKKVQSVTFSAKHETTGMYVPFIRIYIILFAVSSVAINVLSLLKPDFFNPGITVTLGETFIEALPHFIYATLLLIPFRILIKDTYYTIALLLMGFGMIFYWYVTVAIVLKLKLNFLLLVLFAPFAGIPAMLALWLLMERKQAALEMA